MIRYLRQLWRCRRFDRWNKIALERGWEWSVMPPRAWREYLPWAFRTMRDDGREKLALWLAPWLKQEDPW